jgi:microcystin degradation protein MlrC
VVANGDRDAAQTWVDRMLDRAWGRCEEFIYQGESLSQAVGRAKALSDGPILLLDHADNCASGGTQDVMTVIGEVIAQGLENVAVAAVLAVSYSVRKDCQHLTG